MTRTRAVGLLVLLAAACHAPRARAPLTTPSGAPLRLGWVTWSDVNEILYCNRRLDDSGGQVGVLGPCWRLTAGESPRRILSWLNAGRSDETSPNAVPWTRCSVALSGDTQGASATLLTPTSRDLIDDWKPDASTGGDRFAVELSFSPEGKWMAVVRVAVHLGDGERIVEIPSVEIRPLPACR